MIEKPRLGMNSRETYNYLCRLAEEVRKNCLSGDGKTTRVHRSPSGSSVSAIRSGSGAKGGGTGVGLPSGATADKYLLCTDVVDGLPVYAWVNKVVNTNSWRPPMVVGSSSSGWVSFDNETNESGAQIINFTLDDDIFETGVVVGLGSYLTLKNDSITMDHISDYIFHQGFKVANYLIDGESKKAVAIPYINYNSTDNAYVGDIFPLKGHAAYGSPVCIASSGLRYRPYLGTGDRDNSYGLQLITNPDLFDFILKTVDGLAQGALNLKGSETATAGQAFGMKPNNEDGSPAGFGFFDVSLIPTPPATNPQDYVLCGDLTWRKFG